MANELTVEQKLRNLYELQLIDSEMDGIEILKGELPMEVQDLEDEIEGLNTRIRRLQEQVDDIEGEIGRHSANMKEAEMLIARYQSQMDDVKNNREYEALTKEIELQSLEIKLSEKRSRESEEKLEAKRETLNAAKERLEKKNVEIETKRVELEKIITKTNKDADKLRKKSDKARKLIEPRMLKAYDRIRTNYRNGLSVVTVERHACGGCFNQIPPQKQMEISMRHKIISCEHCGRILVAEDIMVDLPAVEEA